MPEGVCCCLQTCNVYIKKLAMGYMSILYVIVNVQAARRYGMYSEAVDYTGRGRSPSHGIVNSRGRHPVLPRRLYVN